MTTLGKHLSPETRAKMSEVKKRKHLHLSAETKAKISIALKGRTLSPEHRAKLSGKHLSIETKEKLSASKMGEKNPNYGNKGEKSPLYGKSLSPEHRAKLSEAHTGEKHNNYGKHRSLETKAKISVSLEGRFGQDASGWKGDNAKPKAGGNRARKMFPCPKGMHRHHIDCNPLNNSPENIMLLTPKEHRQLHSRLRALT